MKFYFTECESCAQKPGSPQLCTSCLANRQTISQMNSIITDLKEQINKVNKSTSCPFCEVYHEQKMFCRECGSTRIS